MPPKVKSHIITATWRGPGTSRVPVMTTARCQRKISSSGKPAPSAIARTVSNVCRRRRDICTTSNAFGVASSSAVTCSLNFFYPLLLELGGDELLEIDLLADLLVLEHQFRVRGRARHEHIVDLPGEFDVRNRQFDRLFLLPE